MNPIAMLLTIAVVVAIIALIHHADAKSKEMREREYYNSHYYRITHNSYNDVKIDAGKWQEWQISQHLAHYEPTGAKCLFNLYIPKYDGTTEIDILMISPYGLFVFESKNYSGWIFGNTHQKNWVQCLRTGRYSTHKEHFYNPLKQNETHIKCLRLLLKTRLPIRSVVVFSDRCEFRDVDVEEADADVLHLSQCYYPVRYAYENSLVQLSQQEIQQLYDKLYPYTQVSADVKSAHIAQLY